MHLSTSSEIIILKIEILTVLLITMDFNCLHTGSGVFL